MKIKCIVFLAIITLAISSCLSKEDMHEINRRQADLIIDAIYEYEDIFGKFPNELDDLIPSYLDSIPTPKGGYDFFYNTNSVDGFILVYQIGPNYGCGYSDDVKDWECGYGD